MSHPSLATFLRPQPLNLAAIYETLLVSGGIALLALSAQAGFPLPFSPVPVTLQTLVVLWLASAFGVRRGGITIAGYLLVGAVGMPVFTQWSGGLLKLAGPTGGYLVGFLLAGILVGWLAQKGWDRRIPTAFAAMVLGNLVIYALGLAWLSRFVPTEGLLAAGLYPFVVGDVFKIVLAALLLPAGWRLAGRRASEG